MTKFSMYAILLSEKTNISIKMEAELIDRYYLNNRPVHFNRKISNYNSGFNDFVEAIHIWLKDGYKPMADLAFISDGVKTIAWDDIEEREKYSFGINAYTIIYDDRAGQSFESHIR